MNLLEKVRELASDGHEAIVAIRQHLHAHPELSFQEYQTSAYIAQQLTLMGIQFTTGWGGGTGIVAIIKGQNPESHTIALRADFDALPIQEANENCAYRSVNQGIMHACGHDVHTASLLGAAKILHQLSSHWTGTVKLIFQPGEEKLPGGASLMIAEGVLQNPAPAAIFGQHVHPSLPAGKIGIKPGMFMASADEIYITVHGKGGHGAMPHDCVDPILIAAHLLVSLQQIVSRNADPTIPSVLSFGKIEGKGATNVIPNQVTIEGTFRTMNEEWRNEAHKRMTNLAESLCAGMGGRCELRIERGYPFLKNHEQLTLRARTYAEEYLGADNVIELPIRMTAEDFAFYSHHVPACFYRLGTGGTAATNYPVHTSSFDIDEAALRTSTGLMAWMALKELQAGLE